LYINLYGVSFKYNTVLYINLYGASFKYNTVSCQMNTQCNESTVKGQVLTYFGFLHNSLYHVIY